MVPTSLFPPRETPFGEIYQPVLKVLGLGGGGCNAVARMMELGVHGVEFIAANTDKQALQDNPAPVKIQLGPKATRGLGSGGDPKIGFTAARESGPEIAAALRGADMVFLTAGMGGGTGTGAIPVAAEIARALGAVTIAIVTTPFSFEMGRRQRNAREGLAQLREKTHTLIAIPNDRLLYVAPRKLPMEVAFRLADDVLRQAVQGIAELITEPGMINVDFAHIRRLIQLGGGALMSIGHGMGEHKAAQALDQALHHPLLESISLERAAGVIANFTGGSDLTLLEVDAAVTTLHAATGPQTETVLGIVNNEGMDDRCQVILVITGLGAPTLEETIMQLQPPRRAEPQPEQAPASRASFSAPAAALPAQPAPAQAFAPEAAYPVADLPPAPSRPRSQASALSSNLDLPAFLRRRMFYNS